MTKFRDRTAMQGQRKFIARPKVDNGVLSYTRNKPWMHDRPPLRLLCAILTAHAFKACLRAHANAGPHGCGWTFLLADGRTVPADAFDVSTREGRDNFRRALATFGTLGQFSGAWGPLACEISHGDFAVYCSFTGQNIPTFRGIIE